MGNMNPSQKMLDAAERIRRYDNLIRKQTGVAVKPLRFDGYFNLLNKYGTQKDTTENYQYATEPPVADEMLSSIYEGNGLFARIIDAPAEEAMKAGFELDGIKGTNLIEFYEAALDDLDWEETCITAIKWARLFGGSIAVMLINDGKGIDDPLDWKNIRSIDGIRVYDRSVVQPDYNSMFSYSPEDPFRARGNMIGAPEFYNINSKYGSFTVHESRCLVFKNGVLPENCSNSIYEMWGMPEYIRIKRAMRDCELAHGNGPKMLERAIQAVYKVRGLSELLQTDAGEDIVVKRLQTIDLARGLLNSIAIDSEGEEYDFKTFAFTGVSEIIDTTCNQLSALTSIPQTILFGRSPAGMNATGESDMENWYSFVGRIQKRMIGRNLRYLLSVIFQAGVMTGEIDEIPPISPKFRPLWSLSELEEAQLEQTKAATQQTKAATAQIYVGMQAVDPSEVRKGLSDSGEFDIETLLDDYTDDELFPNEEQVPDETVMPTEASGEIAEQGDFSEYVETNTAPAEDHAASQTTENTPVSSEEDNIEESENVDEKADSTAYSVGVIVISGGKVLCGDRQSADGYGLICGPGGHIESGENSVQAALRETEEEFGIIPNELIPLGVGSYEPDTGLTPILYLCTDYAEGYGSVDREIINTRFLSLAELEKQSLSLFKPFKEGIEHLLSLFATESAFDGGPGSGNFGHEGREGEIGGSTPGDSTSEAVGKIAARQNEISGELQKAYAEIAKGKATPELIEKITSLSAEFSSLCAAHDEIKSQDPNSRENIAKRYSEEGHPTRQQIMDSLPKEWRDSYYDPETTFGEAFSGKIGGWSGEGYKDLKRDYVIDYAIKNSSAKWSKGDLYRGMSVPTDMVKSLKPGDSLKMDGISSWSSDISQSMRFATTEQEPVLIVDKTTGKRNAMSIAQLSRWEWEREVLYGMDQKFVVKSVASTDVEYKDDPKNNNGNPNKVRKVTVIEVECSD